MAEAREELEKELQETDQALAEMWRRRFELEDRLKDPMFEIACARLLDEMKCEEMRAYTDPTAS